MLELLNQLDGFNQNDKIKVVAATNRIDVLDPALLRSGRIDRKIELPNPNLVARAQILKVFFVHSSLNLTLLLLYRRAYILPLISSSRSMRVK